MRLLTFLAALQIGSISPATHVIVFSPTESVTFSDEAPALDDATQQGLLAAVQSDLQHPAAFSAPIPLTDFPVYGRVVPGAHGELQFHTRFKGAFVTKVGLEGLQPRHKYILTLNGNPEREGNDRLPTPVPGNPREHYLDFQTIMTDDQGRYEALYAIALPAGKFDVRFYVKDTADFKIVLYHDFFPFVVE